MNNALLNAFRFFHEHAGCVVGKRAVGAIALARAERDAAARGLSVTWEADDTPWDGDCPAPKIVAVATVYAPGVDPSTTDGRFPYADGPRRGFVPAGGIYRKREVLASLGGIGLDSWRDDYVRVVEAELLSEALENLDEENDRLATREASELSSRATYAGVSL
jgi:hypothetical protein